MSIYSQDKYHYTYKITILNPLDERKYYVGVRSSNKLPEDDINYLGSSKHLNAYLKNEQIKYKKQILAYFFDRESANQHELDLHNEFDVAKNPSFFNKAKRTSTGFCTEGVPLPKVVCRVIDRKEMDLHNYMHWHKRQYDKDFFAQWSSNQSASQKGKKRIKAVCRISDKKEMTITNFLQWCKFEDDPEYAAEVSAKKSESHKGKPKSKQHAKNIAKALKGFKRPKGCQTAHKNNNAKPANIYDANTNELIAENVIIRPWSMENGYYQSSLAATARNPGTFHKGIYARYI